MILLCGIPSESPVAMVREALDHLGAATIVFNQRHFAGAHIAFAMAQGRVTGEFTRNEATPEAVMSCATGHARRAALGESTR